MRVLDSGLFGAAVQKQGEGLLCLGAREDAMKVEILG